MREILFRGKRTDNGEWVEGYYVCVAEKYHYILTGKLDIYRGNVQFEMDMVIPETVGQYTGLCDKNGKKIFEGDIVKHYCSIVDKNKFDIGDIYYSERCCQFRRTTRTHGQFYTINADCEYEIIGNVNDNPEILKGGAE